MGSQRVGHDWATFTFTSFWRRRQKRRKIFFLVLPKAWGHPLHDVGTLGREVGCPYKCVHSPTHDLFPKYGHLPRFTISHGVGNPLGAHARSQQWDHLICWLCFSNFTNSIIRLEATMGKGRSIFTSVCPGVSWAFLALCQHAGLGKTVSDRRGEAPRDSLPLSISGSLSLLYFRSHCLAEATHLVTALPPNRSPWA